MTLNATLDITAPEAAPEIAPEIAPESVPASIPTDEIERICARIPPLWDLTSYVAVNPFLGFAPVPMPQAAQQVHDGIGGRLLPDLAYYRRRRQEGALDPALVAAAAHRAGESPARLEAILAGDAPMPTRTLQTVLTFAERYDRQHGTGWHEAIIRHAARWCAIHAPENRRKGPAQHGPDGLYTSWREAAQVDRSLEIMGLAGWRAWAQALPATPAEAIAAMLPRLEVSAAGREAYLYRLLGGIFGWAAYLRRENWSTGNNEPGPLLDLLAIRICTDAAVAHLAPGGGVSRLSNVTAGEVEDEQLLAIFQEALEDGYAQGLLGKILPPPDDGTAPRPAVQAALCIDVRSEVLRRHLEAQDPAIQTMGFAGFFGVALDWQVDGMGSARCPALLQPAFSLKALTPPASELDGLTKAIQKSPAAFTYVELLGLLYGLTLAGDALGWRRTGRHDETTAPFSLQAVVHGEGLTLADRTALAGAILTNMGLRERFGRLVLLCGHGSNSENNSHAAGLDCGACAGHSGALNARVAATLLNDPDVRAALADQGHPIPDDTYFVPGLHDTTTDQVTLLDLARAPAGHAEDLRRLQAWLTQAAAAVRVERAAGLGLDAARPSLLDRLLRRRARDWSEARPEWALARNAAFIAARRDRTRGVDLNGRSFLHDYDWTTDPDNAVLTLILSAPMVVASWINLQYFASTVDNEHFGCGTKALHNRVGSTGVVLGNGGDLRTGLSLQSVHGPDGEWYHEPLRLQVVVEAPCARIDAVLAANADVRHLVENGWVRLFALEPEGDRVQQRLSAGRWADVGLMQEQPLAA